MLAFKAYTIAFLGTPTYTTPLATAGEEEIKSPTVYCQCRRRLPTVAGLRRTSYGLKPLRQGSK